MNKQNNLSKKSDDEVILDKLNQLIENQNKSWLLQLNEDSTILITTQDIADFIKLSYRYTYVNVVSQPDFPRPVMLIPKQNKRGRPSHRRWVSGEVVRYFHQQKKLPENPIPNIIKILGIFLTHFFG